MAGLEAMQQGAGEVLAAGGCATAGGAPRWRVSTRRCWRTTPRRVARPIFAATLFLDRVSANAFRGCYGTDYIVIPANRALSGKALAGVGSGDMEVLYTAGQSDTLNVEITTSVDNSQRAGTLFTG
jgi:hypothetical protein